MIINTSKVESVLMNLAIPANFLESEVGINRSAITRLRNGERKMENLTLDTISKVQAWIDAGNYRFSYDYSDLIEELEADIAEGLTEDYIYIVRGNYNEMLEKSPIIDYYYTAEEIEEGDVAEKVLTASVLAEMKADNEIF
nr:MAG TPA_asm: Regulatory protein-modification, helix-turn-helix, transcriptional regulato, DNA [Caudoviricetes sp.]